MFKQLIEKTSFKEVTPTILLDDETSNFPSEAETLIQEGILDGFIPNHLGGKMGSIQDTLELGRLLSRRNLTTAIALGQTLLGSLPVWLYGSDEQKNDLAGVLKKGGLNCLALTEEENGSDLTLTQVRDEVGKISGKKWCINNATKGRALSVLTKNENEVLNVHFIQKDKAHSGSFNNIPKILTLGIRGADISGIELKNFSQENSLLGRPGQGLEIILKTMQISRLLCSSFSLGASDTLLRRALEYALERSLYGKEIIHLPAVSEKLAQSYKKILLIEAFSLMSARFVTMAPEMMSLYSAISKYYVTKLADEIILNCSEVIGARFYIRDSQYGITQKMMRDHRVVSLFDGNSDVNIAIIAGQIKRLATLNPPKEDISEIYDLTHKAPSFSGEEKLKLTTRGRDLIWEAQTNKELFKMRDDLFLEINNISDIQTPAMIKCVEKYCKLTLLANYQLFHQHNKEHFAVKIDVNKMLSDEAIDLALPLEQLKKKCLFSHFKSEIND